MAPQPPGPGLPVQAPSVNIKIESKFISERVLRFPASRQRPTRHSHGSRPHWLHVAIHLVFCRSLLHSGRSACLCDQFSKAVFSATGGEQRGAWDLYVATLDSLYPKGIPRHAE